MKLFQNATDIQKKDILSILLYGFNLSSICHYFYCNYEHEHNVLFGKLNEIIPKFNRYSKKG